MDKLGRPAPASVSFEHPSNPFGGRSGLCSTNGVQVQHFHSTFPAETELVRLVLATRGMTMVPQALHLIAGIEDIRPDDIQVPTIGSPVAKALKKMRLHPRNLVSCHRSPEPKLTYPASGSALHCGHLIFEVSIICSPQSR